MYFQLAHDVCAMCLYCFNADPQNGSDFFTASPLRQELRYLTLSGAQRGAHQNRPLCVWWAAKSIEKNLSGA
jgi:hypothetical protein